MNQKSKSSFLIVLLALGLILAYTMFPLTHLTIFSVDQINIDPEGYLEGNELKGTYWSITLLTDFTETGAFYEFDDVEAHSSKSDPYWNGENMTVKNTIKILITPLQPYYSRKLKLDSVRVAPNAYQNYVTRLGGIGRDKWQEVDALDSGHYTFAESDWTAHTPFNVKLFVNGVLTDEIAEFDTVGGTQTLTLGQDPETVTLSNIGKIITGYLPPVWSDIIWFNHKYFYLKSASVQNAIQSPYPIGNPNAGINDEGVMDKGTYEQSFGWYWYGGVHEPETGIIVPYDRYWKEDGTPECIIRTAVKYDLIPLDTARGWKDGGSDIGVVGRRIPIKPVLFLENKGELPEEKRHLHCLTEFLEKVTKAQKPTMPSWLPNSADIVITEDSEMRLYLPMGSMNALLNVLVSTEIADTFVWKPLLGNFEITKFEDFGDIYEEKQWSITVKQTEDVEAPVSGTIWFTVEPSTLEVGVNPPTIGVQLGYNEEETVTFNILNLAVDEQTDFSIKAEVTNSLGHITDSKIAYGTAMPRSGTVTQLVIYLIDYKDRTPVDGIYVSVVYDTQSKGDISKDGGTVLLDFGSSSPYITVTTQETAIYQSATATKQLSVGSNSMTIELLKHGEVIPPFPWWLTAIIIIVAGAVIVMYAMKRRSET